MPSTRHAANLLYALSWLIGRLPFAVLNAIGATLGQCLYWRGSREARVTRRNLELVQPGIKARQRDVLAAAVLRAVGRNSLHTLRFWTRPWRGNRALIAQVHGEALLHAALARGRGLIIAAPHYGNWELLNQFLASCAAITLVYRPPESAIAEHYLLRVRDRPDVTQVPARSSGVRALLRTLHAGGMVGILPDQRPKAGEGAFAPLFGIQTLTMTLLTRLAQRTGASVLFAIAERRPGFASAHYDVHFFPADAAIGGSDDAAALAALNAGITAIAQRDPLQYQWNYKRFNARPPGSDETNPYLRG
ncbi:MAG: lipid A biosynthesis lauroyl acyltransferase [Xanthomonadaceae bacterium]|nr:lipid A biosynthesis lauroyl acyltransferase [Xanthomonadaceae bacterium]MDP2184879.1 lipid A biosynthesis lauroyl acyltransferase [Xanthomonadales bacterium]MDZ4115631.1 lipid A biosynthesis lauroyl acyltransferase [Xanthomonadaceae bacterium]MDZ4377363.1 lipid A biosynthesis lauroyl acyltransferase [Xanthomonadaceae bacterium]